MRKGHQTKPPDAKLTVFVSPCDFNHHEDTENVQKIPEMT